MKSRIAIRKSVAQKYRLTISALVFYYPLNTGKEVIQKYMSSYHSEVAAA